MIDRRSLCATGALLPFAPALAEAAPANEQDWPNLGRYAGENRALLASGVKTGIVFMGDSITEFWARKRPGFFKPGRVCRGISGQTTPQMLLRMMQDVIQLKPRYVHIMAGTNDIAGNTGPMTLAQTEDNLRAMITLAQANGIKVLLASVPPANGFPWRRGVATVEPIRAVNRWAAASAGSMRATWIDYTPVLADAAGGMQPGLADDGVHPTEAGYDAMATVIEPFLRARKL